MEIGEDPTIALQEILVDCCRTLFSAHGIDIASQSTPDTAAFLLARIDFVREETEKMEGTLTIGLEREKLERSLPIKTDRPPDLESWVRELANQLMGLVRSRLKHHHVYVISILPRSSPMVAFSLRIAEKLADKLPEIVPGTELGNYRVIAKLNLDTGTSLSYLAEHRLFERKVVISHAFFGINTLERFARWLSYMERLRHPQIIGLLDCGQHEGFPYAVMQYVEGRRLSDIVEDGGPIDLLTALRLFSVLANVLAQCHELQIAHGNLKLGHVLVSAEGLPFLKGFESARSCSGPVSSLGLPWTPGWSAPEIWRYQAQWREQRKDIELDPGDSFATSDVWAFGLMMYVALTGHTDVTEGASNDFDGAHARLTSPDPLDLSRLTERAPAAVLRMIGRCLAKSPTDRYRDGKELEHALGALFAHLESERSPAFRIAPEVGRRLLVFAEPLVPASVGQYLELHIVERLGAGAFSEVFRTESTLAPASGRVPLALKVLRAELASEAEAVERFRREAIFLARLSHPHVVKVHAFGKLGDTLFILEELLEGMSLRQWLLGDPELSLVQAVRITRDIASGLTAIHEAGLIHRDLKPANVVLVDGGQRAVVTDLGIAHSSDVSRFTQTGAFVGTPAYAAPEQLLGEPPSVQTDLYALGLVLFELLTGRLAHGRTTLPAVIRKLHGQATQNIRALVAELPEPIAATIDRLLERDPALRPRSSEEVRASIAPYARWPTARPE